MSYLKSALGIAYFDITRPPDFPTIDSTYFLHGYGNDAGYSIYRTSKYIRSQYIGNWYRLNVGIGYDLYPMYQTYNSCACFTYNNSWYLFYDSTYGWAIKGSFLPCYEYWDSSSSHYYGDNFWSTSSTSTTILPDEGQSAVTFKARGYQRGATQGAYEGTDYTLSYKFVRWEGDDLYGEYSPEGGASGTVYVGVPLWSSSAGSNIKYNRSVDKSDSSDTPYYSSAGYYTYYYVVADTYSAPGNIYRDFTTSKWLIGTYGSTSGWYEGDEPSKTGDVKFVFTVPEGSELTGDDITVSFYSYDKGIDTKDIYMCNVGVFLP